MKYNYNHRNSTEIKESHIQAWRIILQEYLF